MLNRRAILAGSAGAAAFGVSGASAAAAPTTRIYSAADFGVQPNVTRDQSVELQAAIDGAIRHGGYLILPPGLYVARGLSIKAPFCLQGVPGLSRIIFAGNGNLLSISDTHNVTLSGVAFDGARQPVSDGLVLIDEIENLMIEQCEFRNSAANGLSVERSAGRIVHNTLAHAADAAIFAKNNRGLEIAHNHVHDMDDNGILIWQSEPREDNSIVSHNRIERIANNSGGSGQYGNGINVFRAGNVTVAHNRISRCTH